MKAVLIEKSRTVLGEAVFFEVVLWHLPDPVPGSAHPFKYRLALVVNGECVLRYDNERGKGDHRHIGASRSRSRSRPWKHSTMHSKPTWKGF